MRVLITNDDGIHTPGILYLARAIVAAGHDAVVVAPLREYSGAGAAVGGTPPGGRIVPERVTLPELPDVPAFAIDSPPAMGVSAAQLGAFGPVPDIVVSGINTTWNPGWQILHSGTVGAAMTAANFGGRGVSVSLDVPADGPVHWDTAAGLAVHAAAAIGDAPPQSVWSLNVPNTPTLNGVRQATLATHQTIGVVSEAGAGSPFSFERKYDGDLADDSDVKLLLQNYATVTAIAIPGADTGASTRQLVAAFIERTAER